MKLSKIAGLLTVACIVLVGVNSVEAKTLSVFSGSGDGHVSNSFTNSWDVAHDATTGTNVNYTTSDWHPLNRIGDNGIQRDIYRAFMVFDTSALPDNAGIIGADTGVYVGVVENEDNDAYAYMGLYQGFQASTAAIVAEDFDQCGTVNNPEAGASVIDLDSVSVNDYMVFNMNATGTSWISASGHTKLCLREGHDAGDHDLVGGAYTYSGIRGYASEEAGTSKDSYLEMTYSLPPLPPEQLYTEGTTTPEGVSDTTPEFSAVFVAPESTDTATHYEIEVSASSTDWTGLMWDSGKTSMSSVNAGARMSDVSYAGSSLGSNGTTYFWRIKFWNSNGVEGYWSGPHYFTTD